MTRLVQAAFLALLMCAIGEEASAQRAAARPAATPAAIRHSVLVLPVVNDLSDSIRTILERDLDHGDVLQVVRRDPELLRTLVEGDSPPILQADSVGQLGARYVIRAYRLRDTLRVMVYDSAAAGTAESRSYPVPTIAAPRARFVHDSITRAFGAREQAARNRLVQLGVTYDSLLRAARGRQPRNAQQRARVSAQRDTMFRSIASEAPLLHAAIARMPTERDSAVALHVARETARYDSTSYVQRMALHAAADEVQHWLTGVRGAAASRIAFVRRGLLHVVDSDGANERVLTRAGRALSPAWHPSGRWIVYSDITDIGTQIAEADVGTGRVRLLTATPRGYNITPVYTPDGRHIVYAATSSGGSELVSLNRETSEVTRLGAETRNASSPTFSPDGQRIAMVIPKAWSGSGASARMTPQLYITSAAGTRLDQLTPTKAGVRSYRTSPEWSPNGQYVAFTQQGGGFQVWLVDVRNRTTRQLTSGTDHEDASWAPDSRHVVLTAGRDVTELVILDIETGRRRALPVKHGARLPAWSPRWTPAQPVVRPGDRYAATSED